MLDWLKPLPLMFYAPRRGMAAVRDRAPLGAAALLAFVTAGLRSLLLEWSPTSGVWGLAGVVSSALWPLMSVGLFFVPITIFVANLFERRASFGLAVRQDYAALASAMFYAWSAASILTLPLAALSRAWGLEAQLQAAGERSRELQRQLPQDGTQPDPRLVAEAFGMLGVVLLVTVMSPLPFFLLWAVVAVREVFRFSWARSVAVVIVSCLFMIPALFVLLFLLSTVLGSPFILLLLFFLLRGYFSEVMRTQRARASFRQNLEAATLNPADASAHYNLGLIHLDRKELAEARARFRRAVEIDAEETDAHYQLGRISRAEGKLSEAIEHFGRVVERAPDHAQHEVWREIGATYLAAGQFADAHDALEKFLDRRPSDPEGLYLQGRALAGMGRRREAADLMRACIEAVRTAPAYKYRTEKRWLNEAQQFLRTQA
ncbi:MAG TPA: tetratricopeptide repeat protein [Pyrinomonadaceae bacterium]|nr:tetratricopeptide repeat protein [Pyrinomonadaceae bacterium]